MDGASHQLLARAALACEEDRAVGLSHLGDEGQDAPHGRALADEARDLVAVGQRVLERAVVGQESPSAERLGDRGLQVVGGERLCHVVEGAHLDRLDGALDRGIPRDDDDRDVGELVGHLAQDVHAADIGELEVHQGHVAGSRGECLEALDAVVHHVDVVVLAEYALATAADDGIVVNNQDPCFLAHRAVPSAL